MNYVTIALGKGRLVEETLSILEEAGIVFPDFSKKSRKLIFENKRQQLRMVLVKASDVPTYVERGAADLGVVGKDTLLESQAKVYEVVDLGFGICKFAVAGLNASYRNKAKPIIATKYPNVAKAYFQEKGQSIETIKLNGSVELAPLIGLSDCIVDIVETGKTLKENGLQVYEEISYVSARLIANRASFKTKFTQIGELINSIQEVVDQRGERS